MSTQTAPQWLENCIIEGLQMLLVLRLRNAPAADTINAVVNVWLMAFMDGRYWDEHRDAPRIQQAFMTVVRTADAWASPAQVLKALPALLQQPFLDVSVPKSTPEHVAQCKERIKQAQQRVFKKTESL